MVAVAVTLVAVSDRTGICERSKRNQHQTATPVKKRHRLKGLKTKRNFKQSCVVHNHPSGDPTPSRADIEMTKTIIDTAKPLGIAVHDHIIIGKDGHASFKGLRLI